MTDPLPRFEGDDLPAENTAVILLTLDSLADVWDRMDLPEAARLRAPLRDAVRTVAPVLGETRAALPNAAVERVAVAAPDLALRFAQWLDGWEDLPWITPAGQWEKWFSKNRRLTALPSLAPDAVVRLMARYKAEVPDAGRALLDWLDAEVPSRFLSDWDLHIHATHALCYVVQHPLHHSATFLSLRFEYQRQAFARLAGDVLLHLPRETLDHIEADLRARRAEADAYSAEEARSSPVPPPKEPIPPVLPLKEALEWRRA